MNLSNTKDQKILEKREREKEEGEEQKKDVGNKDIWNNSGNGSGVCGFKYNYKSSYGSRNEQQCLHYLHSCHLSIHSCSHHFPLPQVCHRYV